MTVNFVDLRRNAANIRRALERRESVTLLYRGKPLGTIEPLKAEAARRLKVQDHPAFGMWAHREDMRDVYQYVRNLRNEKLNRLRLGCPDLGAAGKPCRRGRRRKRAVA